MHLDFPINNDFEKYAGLVSFDDGGKLRMWKKYVKGNEQEIKINAGDCVIFRDRIRSQLTNKLDILSLLKNRW